MSECHKKAWNRQAQRRRGGERGGWRDLRRQTTDKKILSGKKGVFCSPLFVPAGGMKYQKTAGTRPKSRHRQMTSTRNKTNTAYLSKRSKR